MVLNFSSLIAYYHVQAYSMLQRSIALLMTKADLAVAYLHYFSTSERHGLLLL